MKKSFVNIPKCSYPRLQAISKYENLAKGIPPMPRFEDMLQVCWDHYCRATQGTLPLNPRIYLSSGFSRCGVAAPRCYCTLGRTRRSNPSPVERPLGRAQRSPGSATEPCWHGWFGGSMAWLSARLSRPELWGADVPKVQWSWRGRSSPSGPSGRAAIPGYVMIKISNEA